MIKIVIVMVIMVVIIMVIMVIIIVAGEGASLVELVWVSGP